MLDRERERIVSRALAQLREQGDFAAAKLLERRAERTEHRSRSHRDAADHAVRAHDAIAVEKIRGRRHELGWGECHEMLLVDESLTTIRASS
jgi:hypothetical protein